MKIITWSFYILFFFTPLFFLKYNNELFEYNKMMLVYLLTTIITSTWLIKMVKERSLILKRTPLDIPILLFLASQILSTIFSIDPHTSLWGYYSRSNGGLLSIISYTLLFYALVSNFDARKALSFLKAAIFGGVAVSLYAIPEHFGVSPSCVILVNTFSADCWVQDVQARVFATLGQPNWLAAYLAMLIFPAIYFTITSTKKLYTFSFALSAILMYAAFTFSYSRGATLGLITGGVVFIIGLVVSFVVQSIVIPARFDESKTRREKAGIQNNKSRIIIERLIVLWTKYRMTILGVILASFFVINLLYGSAWTRFKLINPQVITPQKQQAAAKEEVKQLEPGGTESGQIRLIVWKGALEIFKHYPLFGSGVETFAYSYYNHRPTEHNLVSEWDFLYNKAHNEYLNYLATTGLAGFISYMSMILIFIFWCIRYYVSGIMGKQNKTTLDTKYLILVPSLLASYLSYLVQNIFGFSVVVIAVFFFTFPALAFLAADSLKSVPSGKLSALTSLITNTIYRRKFYKNLTIGVILILTVVIIFKLIAFWTADVLYAKGTNLTDAGNPVKGARYLSTATKLNPNEPLYRSELGYAAAGYAAVALEQDEATIASQLKEEAVEETKKALAKSPKNVSLHRTAFQTYYQLALIYPEFLDKAIEAVDKAISLAPTDAKLYYNKGLVLSQFERKKEAIETLQKAVELKPNYREARFNLAVTLFETGKKDQAVSHMKTILKQIPNDPDVLSQLKEWEEKEKKPE